MTTSNITADIQAAIKANLPAQVSEVLQTELAELVRLRNENARITQNTLILSKRFDDLQTQVESLTAQLKDHATLATREASVTARENTQALRDLEVKLADLRRKDAVDLVGMVFRSPVYRETVAANVNVAVPGAGGGMGYTTTMPETSTKTISTE
jgi:hypothetical protein